MIRKIYNRVKRRSGWAKRILMQMSRELNQHKMQRKLKRTFDGCRYFFCIDFMGAGGAESVCRRFMSTLLELDPGANVALFVTNEKSDIDASVLGDERIKIYKIAAKTEYYDYAKVCFNVINQIRPVLLQVSISEIGYEVIRKYGGRIEKFADIRYTDFGLFADGKNYCSNQYPELSKYAKIITDNELHRNRIINNHNINTLPSNVIAYNMPVELDSNDQILRPTTGKKLRILFASRMDVDKRPDIALMVAKKLKEDKYNAEVDFYGGISYGDESYIDSVKRSEGVKYNGAFTGGLRSLNVQDYDIFLLTSPSEGMPNGVLEAMSLGLVVLSSAVGGVPYVIKNKKTGFIVKKFDDIDGYIKQVEYMIDNRNDLNKIRKAARKLIEDEYAYGQFKDRLSHDIVR